MIQYLFKKVHSKFSNYYLLVVGHLTELIDREVEFCWS